MDDSGKYSPADFGRTGSWPWNRSHQRERSNSADFLRAGGEPPAPQPHGRRLKALRNGRLTEKELVVRLIQRHDRGVAVARVGGRSCSVRHPLPECTIREERGDG